ncbi:MAG: hypothetical protein HQM13_02165 [SAR324 cluster bacterium]|nr:hypothetical protein [SAR324 cluster bacterium]
MLKPRTIVICLTVIILTAWSAAIVAVENLAVKSAIDKTVLTTGDFLVFQVEVSHPGHIQLKPISLNQYFEEGMDVEPIVPSESPMDSSEEGNWLSRWWPFEKEEKVSLQNTFWSWRLWPTREGSWTIPEISIQSVQTDKEGNSALFHGSTQTLTFTVNSIFKDQENPVLKINKNMPEVPLTIPWLWLTTAGIIVIFLGLAWVFYKRRKRPLEVEAEELPHERALRRLKELEQFLLTNPQEVHQYYYLLSEIFREYLEKRFGFSASSMTTQEFLPMLEAETSYTAEERNRIVLLTQKSDLIKYAEVSPMRKEMDDAYREVIELVERTAYIGESDPDEETKHRKFREAS